MYTGGVRRFTSSNQIKSGTVESCQRRIATHLSTSYGLAKLQAEGGSEQLLS